MQIALKSGLRATRASACLHRPRVTGNNSVLMAATRVTQHAVRILESHFAHATIVRAFISHYSLIVGALNLFSVTCNFTDAYMCGYWGLTGMKTLWSKSGSK